MRRANRYLESPLNIGHNIFSLWADEVFSEGKENILNDALPQFERTLLLSALSYTKGHKQDAARLLGWGRNTLTRKLKELGIEEF